MRIRKGSQSKEILNQGSDCRKARFYNIACLAAGQEHIGQQSKKEIHAGGGQLHDALHAADDRECVYNTGNDQNSNGNPFGAFHVEQAGSRLAHQRGGQTEGGGRSG